MSIERRVQLVEMLFYDLEIEISQFQKETKLSCVAGCGKCCTHPAIDASPLEFLPWAFQLFLKGEAEQTLTQLDDSENLTCHVYKPLALPGQGRCTDYKYRGLICRLFGFGASRDKYGNLRLATCKIIKEGQSKNYEAAQQGISESMKIPIFTDYYLKLSQIDHHLGNMILPINKALKIALEEVLQYYHYRPEESIGLNAG